MPSKSVPRPTWSIPAISTAWRDVVDDAVERERSRLTLEESALVQEELRVVPTRERSVFGRLAQPRVLLLRLAREERDAQRDAHDAAVPGQGPELRVRQVAGMIVQLPATGMAGDDGLRRDLERLLERSLARVGEVDDHPELVHRLDHFPAERGEAGRDRRRRAVAAGADPGEVVVPDERQDAHAVLEELAEAIETLLDGVSALDAGDARDPARGARRLEIARVPGEPDAFGMAFDEQVELAQERFGPFARASGAEDVLRIDPGHEDHGSQSPLGAADEIEMPARLRAEVLTQVELTLEGIDVSVEDRDRVGSAHAGMLRVLRGPRQAEPWAPVSLTGADPPGEEVCQGGRMGVVRPG
jgi:hypothetical protein